MSDATESSYEYPSEISVDRTIDKGRTPPFSMEMEENVLGCILIFGDVINSVLIIFGDAYEGIFYVPKHRLIFKAILELNKRNEVIDLETVANELDKLGTLESIGGYHYIATLSAKIATAANVENYARILKEKYLFRQMIKFGADISRDAYNESEEVFDLIEHASKKIFDISQNSIRKQATDIKKLIHQTMGLILELANRKDGLTGVSAGFKDLDNITAGFQNGDMIILAARPSTGKTAISLHFARTAAVVYKVPVLYFSLEMAELQLALRLLCAEAKVSSQNIRTGKFGQREIAQIQESMDSLNQSTFLIDDTPSITIVELCAKARRMKQEKKIGMIVIDYLQLITPIRDNKSMNREQEIAQISRMIKALAKELNIPIIALAQLNRQVETRGEKKPQLSDLRDSGNIEQDADLVMFLSRPETYGKLQYEDGSSTENIIEIIIGKQRNGPVGECKLVFLKEYGRFESYARAYTEANLPAPSEAIKQIQSAKKFTPPPKPTTEFADDNAPF